jgi:diketogulonate reductase-like aldo/keto reductase
MLLFVDGAAAEQATLAVTGDEACLACTFDDDAGFDALRLRLGRAPNAALLRCADGGWEARWPALVAAASAAGATAGLQVAGVAEALAALAAASPPPALLALPLHPGSPKAHRLLAGQCRRRGVTLMALSPLGDKELRAHRALAEAGTARIGGAAEVLLAWCVGRGAVALADGQGGGRLEELLSCAGRGLVDLDAVTRGALDSMAAP